MEVKQRPRISQTVIDEFTKLIDSQDEKGIKKYGTTIDEAADKDYNWQLMALEEAADLQKYLVKKIVELQLKVAGLKSQTSYQRFLDMEKENLLLARENQRLLDMLQTK